MSTAQISTPAHKFGVIAGAILLAGSIALNVSAEAEHKIVWIKPEQEAIFMPIDAYLLREKIGKNIPLSLQEQAYIENNPEILEVEKSFPLHAKVDKNNSLAPYLTTLHNKQDMGKELSKKEKILLQISRS